MTPCDQMTKKHQNSAESLNDVLEDRIPGNVPADRGQLADGAF